MKKWLTNLDISLNRFAETIGKIAGIAVVFFIAIQFQSISDFAFNSELTFLHIVVAAFIGSELSR